MFTRILCRWIISLLIAVAFLAVINTLLTQPTVQARHAATTTCLGSIQACIDAAADGDTILIPAGTYTESLTLSKPVSVTGVNSATTIVHAVAGQRVLTVTGATITNSVVISGLTLTGGDVRAGTYVCPQNCGGGIWIDDAARPTLDNIIVVNNAADRIGGIHANVLSLKDSLIINNSGGGADAVTATINGGQFAGNTLFGGLVVESLMLNGTAFISNTNTGSSESGGVTVYQTAIISGAQFEENFGGAGLGGGALLARNAPLVITNTLFRHNDNSAIYVDNADTTLNNCRFESNYGAAYGAGIWAFGTVTATDTVFISNTAKDGGAGLTATNAHISGGSFEDNHSDEIYGGGLYVPGEVTITGTRFISNSAQNGGGGYLGTAVITNTHFIQNAASSEGGGAFVFGPAVIATTAFVSNSAAVGGGMQVGEWNAPSSLNMTGTIFLNNSAGSGGGGLSAYGAITLTQVDFFSNTAQLNCGGACFSGEASINGGHFVNNRVLAVNGDSGGLGADGPATISGTEFISNSASIGGGMYANYTTTLYHARFDSNSATTYGGGVVAANAWIISDSDFSNNTAANGGGLVIGLTFMTNTRFINNTATERGGGMFVNSYEPMRLVNNLFSGNSAGLGGAAMRLSNYDRIDLLHSTIASSAFSSVSAIDLDFGTLNVTNTIITSHTIAISSTSGAVYEDYNLFFGNMTNTVGAVVSGGHGLIGDPHFVDPAPGRLSSALPLARHRSGR